MRPLANQRFTLPDALRERPRQQDDSSRSLRGGAKACLPGFVAAIALFATASIGLGADFDVGRVTLRVTDDGWTSVGASGDEMPFSGSASGAIEVAKRSLLLVDGANRFRAALVVSASRGVPAMKLQWPDDCRSQDDVYAFDSRQKSADARDCLRVTGLASVERSLATDAPAVAAALANRRAVVPSGGYVVLAEVALGNGTFVSVEALIAAEVELPGTSISQHDLPAGINAAVAGWALRLAQAARSSIHSVSGLLLVPAVTAMIRSPQDR